MFEVLLAPRFTTKLAAVLPQRVDELEKLQEIWHRLSEEERQITRESEGRRLALEKTLKAHELEVRTRGGLD